MIARLLVDEDFRGTIVRGLLRRMPDVDLLTAHRAGLRSTADPAILDFAAASGRILLTHDAATMVAHAYDRVRRGADMPGVILVPQSLSVGLAVEELEVIIACGESHDFRGIVFHL